MPDSRSETIYYKRSRFLTHLPKGHLYTRSHFWLVEWEAGIWRIGMTKFATRMLGDIVEFGFQAKHGDKVSVGQAIGWIEGFKAVSDIYSVAEGQLHRLNSAIESDITLIDTKPYSEGWLYEVRGTPESQAVDVNGYVAILDETVDRMLGSRHESKEANG